MSTSIFSENSLGVLELEMMLSKLYSITGVLEKSSLFKVSPLSQVLLPGTDASREDSPICLLHCPVMLTEYLIINISH